MIIFLNLKFNYLYSPKWKTFYKAVGHVRSNSEELENDTQQAETHCTLVISNFRYLRNFH